MKPGDTVWVGSTSGGRIAIGSGVVRSVCGGVVEFEKASHLLSGLMCLKRDASRTRRGAIMKLRLKLESDRARTAGTLAGIRGQLRDLDAIEAGQTDGTTTPGGLSHETR